MAADTSTLAPLLKDDYGKALRNQMNDEVPMLRLFEREDNAQWQGAVHIEPVHVNRNRGSYSTVEGGAAPDAGFQQIERLYIPVRYYHGAVQITTQLIKASRNNKGAFARGMRLEMDRLMDDIRSARNFYMWGDGRGIRAFINGGSPTTTTLTLDAPGGVAGSTNGSRYINVNDYVALVSQSTGALINTVSRKVLTVPAAGTTCTIDAAFSSGADNNYVVKAYGSDTSLSINNTDWNHCPMGMRGMIDDGTVLVNYFGLSRSTFPILGSTVTASVGAMSADLLQRHIDVVSQRGKGKIRYLLCHPSVRRAYASIMENDRRYTQGQLMSPDAGTKVAKDPYGQHLDFGGIPFHIDHDGPYGELIGWDNSNAVRYVMTEGEWADETGAVLTEVAGAVDTYKAIWRIYDNFCDLQPNRSFRLTGINANVVVVHVV